MITVGALLAAAHRRNAVPVDLYPLRSGFVNVNAYDGNYVASASFDSNVDTFSAGIDTAPARFGLDFGGTPRTVARITFTPRNGYGSRMDNGTFCAADAADFSDEVVILTVGTGYAYPNVYDLNTTTQVARRYVYFKSAHNAPNFSSNIAEQRYYGF